MTMMGFQTVPEIYWIKIKPIDIHKAIYCWPYFWDQLLFRLFYSEIAEMHHTSSNFLGTWVHYRISLARYRIFALVKQASEDFLKQETCSESL